jgi:hypothetical protein
MIRKMILIMTLATSGISCSDKIEKKAVGRYVVMNYESTDSSFELPLLVLASSGKFDIIYPSERFAGFWSANDYREFITIKLQMKEVTDDGWLYFGQTDDTVYLEFGAPSFYFFNKFKKISFVKSKR